jgi:hypothetical protein
MKPLIRVIYASRSRGFAMQHAIDIRKIAEVHNRQHGITGALVATRQRFLQVLEGPELSVHALYGRIARDARHESCTLLLDTAVDYRLWPDWSMKLLNDSQFERRAGTRGLSVDQLPDDAAHALQWVDLLYSFANEVETGDG